jgi:hypothetical protein
VTDISDDYDDWDGDDLDDGYEDPEDYEDERDYWQEYKDGVATGLLNPDGSQREPDPPEDDRDYEYQAPRATDGGADDPWALPPGTEYATDPPF